MTNKLPPEIRPREGRLRPASDSEVFADVLAHNSRMARGRQGFRSKTRSCTRRPAAEGADLVTPRVAPRGDFSAAREPHGRAPPSCRGAGQPRSPAWLREVRDRPGPASAARGLRYADNARGLSRRSSSGPKPGRFCRCTSSGDYCMPRGHAARCPKEDDRQHRPQLEGTGGLPAERRAVAVRWCA